MAELVALGLEIKAVDSIGLDFDRDALDHFKTIALEADDLFRIIGQQGDLAHPEIPENLGADAIVAQVGLVAEGLIGFDRILALVLQGIGHDLFGEADAAPLLAHVEQDPAALLFNFTQGKFELFPAVAAHRMKDIAGEALGVDADQDGIFAGHLPLDQGEVVMIIDLALVDVEGKVPEAGRKVGAGDAVDEDLVAAAVFDHGTDGDDAQVELARQTDRN